MKAPFFGLLLLLFLVLPPVAGLMESVMIIHMHMQMPLLVFAGFLIAGTLLRRFHTFFAEWNSDGIPGILLFVITVSFWTIPRTMDDALTLWYMELFKFVSLPLLAGLPLRDSWPKLTHIWKNGLIVFFAVLYLGMGWLYIWSPVQLCNNYLLLDQITLGWGFLATAVCMVIYLVYSYFTDMTRYRESGSQRG
jgi:hypothetical protein